MARVLSGVTLAAFVVALIWWLPPVYLLAFALGVTALAFVEYARLAAALGARPPWWPSMAATLVACALVPYPWTWFQAAFAVTLVAIAVAVMRDARGPQALQDVATAVFAPVYLGLPVGTIVALLRLAGADAVLLMIGTIVVSDTAQYYAGRAFGRRPLAPRLSPKKTVEGAIGGLVVAPVALTVAGAWVLPDVAPAWLATLGVAMVAAGIAGDLFESTLKRAAGVKDSAALIPGHGGVLDRIDALLFAAPLFYFFLRLV